MLGIRLGTACTLGLPDLVHCTVRPLRRCVVRWRRVLSQAVSA